MNFRTMLWLSFVLTLLFIPMNTRSQGQVTVSQDVLNLLERDATGKVEIVWNPQLATPGFIRGQFSAPTSFQRSPFNIQGIARQWLHRYASVMGITSVDHELVLVNAETDHLGLHHLTFQQISQGIPVYNRVVRLHLDNTGTTLVALSNSFVPTTYLPAIETGISSEQAIANAQIALSDGKLVGEPELVIWANQAAALPKATLVWLVEQWDVARFINNIYVIRVTDGAILDVWEPIHEARNRKVYSAQNKMVLPGVLVRSEGDPPTGDVDADLAYDFAGATYDYYFNSFGRDSYDNHGGIMTATVHIGPNYVNAAFIPEENQIAYGHNMVTLDITGHEWTHAVINNSANLEYRWQSGALNESLADVFGVMIDREDWLVGEDLPATVLRGADAIRDMANPARLRQPAHTDQWVATCGDQEGVHTNSGITNKAYYNVATTIGKEKAEQIFYRTLTQYLQATSSLEAMRTSALQAAQDLYGQGSAEYKGVIDGFTAVGLNGSWNPPANECSCAVSAALESPAVSSNQLTAINRIATLYRLRDELLRGNEVGEHYRNLYEEYRGRATHLLLQEPALLTAGGETITQFLPGVTALLDEQGETMRLDQTMLQALRRFLQELAAADRKADGSALAAMVEQEIVRVDWDLLVGMSFAEAWEYFTKLLNTQPIKSYLPLIRYQ